MVGQYHHSTIDLVSGKEWEHFRQWRTAPPEGHSGGAVTSPHYRPIETVNSFRALPGSTPSQRVPATEITSTASRP